MSKTEKPRHWKTTRKWKRSNKSTKKAYLENLTTKFDFSKVVIGSDLKAILFAFTRDLPLLIEEEHLSTYEIIENDIPTNINSDSIEELKNSLLFVMNLNGKVFSYNSIQIEYNMIKTSDDVFYINSAYYSKLIDPFNPDDSEILVIDKITYGKIPRRKKEKFFGLSFERENKRVFKIITIDKTFYCFSWLQDLTSEENRVYSIKFEVEEILKELNWYDYPIQRIEREISYHIQSRIEFDNYTDISTMSFDEILTTEEESWNLKIYGKLGQTFYG